MTEDYRMAMFVCIEKKTNLKIVLISEENSEVLKNEMERWAQMVWADFERKGLYDIIDLSEKAMF
jgi:hypothetical protein